MCIASVTHEIHLMTMFDKPDISTAHWLYSSWITFIWYSTIAVNTNILMKIVFLAVEMV